MQHGAHCQISSERECVMTPCTVAVMRATRSLRASAGSVRKSPVLSMLLLHLAITFPRRCGCWVQHFSAHAQEESRGIGCGIEHNEPHILQGPHEHGCDYRRCFRRIRHAARDGHRRHQGQLPSCFGHGLAVIPPDNGRAFQANVAMMASGQIALRAANPSSVLCCAPCYAVLRIPPRAFKFVPLGTQPIRRNVLDVTAVAPYDDQHT